MIPRPAWMLLVCLCGCPRAVPPPPRPPPPPAPPIVQIPAGCDGVLSGEWQHQDDPTFRYHLEDDRKDVTAWVYRVFDSGGQDAGATVADAGSPATAVVHLRRTAEGFVGIAQSVTLLPSGRECTARFQTRVTACTPSTLTLSSATSTPVGEGCQTPALPQPAAMLEHRLARVDAGAL